jgi:hypothetical protein
MKRREVLRALGTLTVAAVANNKVTAKDRIDSTIRKETMPSTQLIKPDDYFLSATNPTANVDQRAQEALGIRVLAMPAVQKAKAAMAQRWKTIAMNSPMSSLSTMC